MLLQFYLPRSYDAINNVSRMWAEILDYIMLFKGLQLVRNKEIM